MRFLLLCAAALSAGAASIHRKYKTTNGRVTDGRVNVHIITHTR